MSQSPTTNEVATEIKKLDWDEPGKYRVEWSSADRWDYDAPYTVTEIRFGEGGRPMLKIEGPGGGEFLIDSNPTGRPKAKYLPPNGNLETDRLAGLRIYEEQVDWRHRLFRMMPGVKASNETA